MCWSRFSDDSLPLFLAFVFFASYTAGKLAFLASLNDLLWLYTATDRLDATANPIGLLSCATRSHNQSNQQTMFDAVWLVEEHRKAKTAAAFRQCSPFSFLALPMAYLLPLSS